MTDAGEAIEDIVPWGWPYAPAFMLSGIHWLTTLPELVIPFWFIVVFVVGVFAIVGNCFFLLMGRSFKLKRLLLVVFPGTAEALLPGVNMIPMMMGSVWAIYLQDKKEILLQRAAMEAKERIRKPGRLLV